MHDLVIHNARLIDGLGTPARDGSLAVKDGRIAAITSDRRGTDLGSARERVDAQGLVLAPGIVDLHTHYDAQLTWDPYATPSTGLGVTTVVIGNCGFTIAPCRPAHRDLVVRNLTHVEGMSLEAMRAGIRWDFESYPEYLASLERRGLVPNVTSFVGHSSVRTYVLGEDATRRPATDAEISEMRRLVLEAVRAGAIGFATSTLEQHNGENGVPMPSRLADEREMAALTGALGEAGRGVFMLTKGMTSTVPWLESIAARNGRPVMIAAMFVDPGDPTRVFRELGEIESARSRGRELWAQVMAERFGARDPRSLALRFHTQTAGSTLTAQQPENNMVRVAIQALSAVLGGTQSLHTNAFDEALGLPTEKAALIALRTQQVIAHESGVTNTVDPAGGAYAIEARTREIVEDLLGCDRDELRAGFADGTFWPAKRERFPYMEEMLR